MNPSVGNEAVTLKAKKCVRENGSFAPLGLNHFQKPTHGLRRGLYSVAASRLENAGLVPP